MDRMLNEMCFFKAKDINGNWLTGTVAYLPKSKDSENMGIIYQVMEVNHMQ